MFSYWPVLWSRSGCRVPLYSSIQWWSPISTVESDVTCLLIQFGYLVHSYKLLWSSRLSRQTLKSCQSVHNLARPLEAFNFQFILSYKNRIYGEWLESNGFTKAYTIKNMQIRTTRSLRSDIPPPPHDYPYPWFTSDPKSKQDKVKV